MLHVQLSSQVLKSLWLWLTSMTLLANFELSNRASMIAMWRVCTKPSRDRFWLKTAPIVTFHSPLPLISSSDHGSSRFRLPPRPPFLRRCRCCGGAGFVVCRSAGLRCLCSGD
ncbi:hypothetical protein SBBP2_890016 [Burkholderiales bacterium]|nr:hypothetical protein SBBP2_890016 [Burkholderiales bacterium]